MEVEAAKSAEQVLGLVMAIPVIKIREEPLSME
jgi:hypothetical protein